MAHNPLDPTHKKTGATKTTAGSTYDFRNNPKGTFGSPGDTSTPPKQGTLTKLKANADRYSGSNKPSSGAYKPTAAELAAFNKKNKAKSVAVTPHKPKPAPKVIRGTKPAPSHTPAPSHKPAPSRTHTSSPATPAPTPFTPREKIPAKLSKKDRIRKMKADRSASRAKAKMAKLKARVLKRASKLTTKSSRTRNKPVRNKPVRRVRTPARRKPARNKPSRRVRTPIRRVRKSSRRIRRR